MEQLKLKPLLLFIQHVTQEVFETILIKNFSAPNSVSTHEVPWLTDEENALTYGAGYVIRSIKEKLKKPKDDDKLTILNNLVQNCTERTTYPSTSEKWVDAVDRGSGMPARSWLRIAVLTTGFSDCTIRSAKPLLAAW